MREEMARINAERQNEDLLLKIGIHEGPCLAVTLNNRQDYFGQTVNIAARVQGLASSRAIFVTQPVIDDQKDGKYPGKNSACIRPCSARRCAALPTRRRCTRFPDLGLRAPSGTARG